MITQLGKILLGLALFLMMGGWTISSGQAADWSVVPSVGVKGEFNSNLNYNFKNPISDYIFSLTPTVEFNYAQEVGQLQGRLGFKPMHYISHSNLDKIDQNYQINGYYMATQRLKLGLTSSYITDSTLQEELTTSGRFMNRSLRTSIQAGPSLTYSLTERLQATLGYGFYHVEYEDPRFQDYRTQSVNSGLDYLLSNQKTKLSLYVMGRSNYYDNGNLYRTLSGYLGVDHQFSPLWTVTLNGGLSNTWMRSTTQAFDFTFFPYFITLRQQVQRSTALAPYINISSKYRWTDKFTLNAGYSYDQSASAQGQLQNFQRFSLVPLYNFTEKLSGSVPVNFSYSSAQSNRYKNKTLYCNISPQLTYRLQERLSLTGAYSFGLREDQIAKRSANQQVAWLMLSYYYPIHYQK
jgi:hypothetical protein